MSYEAFREQCIQAVESERLFALGLKAFANNDCVDRVINKLRALPLPEVTQSPDAYLHSWLGGRRQNLSRSPTWTKIFSDDQDQPDDLIVSALYLLPPDPEALRKENEQLRAAIQCALPALIELDGQDSETEAFTIHLSDEIEALERAMKGGAE